MSDIKSTNEKIGRWVDGSATELPGIDIGTLIAGEDITANRLLTEYGCQYTNITGVHALTAVSANPGYLHGILIGTPVTTKTILVEDGETAIATITCSGAVPVFVPFDCRFGTSLNVTPNDDGLNITVIWR